MLLKGFGIGHADDQRLKSGVTVILPDRPATAAVHVMGGAPGTRETDLLSPEQMVQTIDAIVLSGGSAFGLDAASGAQAWLREQNRGYPVGEIRVPIVPSAICFDLNNGGDKSWGRYPPYRELGHQAASQTTSSPEEGSVGAGSGATTAGAAGGFGLAEQTLEDEIVVSAAVVCNAVGSVFVGDTHHYWAAPFELNDEFGGRGLPHPLPSNAHIMNTKRTTQPMENTTLAVVMTNVSLSQAECKRIAVNAHDGFARAIYPVHTPSDGDLVFVISSNEIDIAGTDVDTLHLGTAAANVVARAITKGVHLANR